MISCYHNVILTWILVVEPPQKKIQVDSSASEQIEELVGHREFVSNQILITVPYNNNRSLIAENSCQQYGKKD